MIKRKFNKFFQIILCNKSYGYTLAEIVIVLLIIAVIVAVTIGITKAKLDNIISYTYYSAYSSLKSVTSEMLADFNSNSSDYTDTALNYREYNLLKKIPIIAYLISNSVNAETARLYKCPDYQSLPSGMYYSYGSYISATGNNGIPSGKIDPSDLKCSYNDILNYLKTQYNQNICTNKRSDGLTTYGSCTCDCSTIISVGSSVTCRTSQTGIYSCGANAINNTPSCQSSGYTLQGDYCVHEYECPEGTYPHYTEAVTGWYTYDCIPYTVCADGTKVKIDESCPDPACNIPSELEQKQQYCANGYSNFNSSSDVCDYTIKPSTWPPACPDGYVWNNEETDCKCVPTPKTIPRKGDNFCKLFKDYANTKSGTDDTSCLGSDIEDTNTNFKDKKPDIILRNGLLIYNLHSNPTAIPVLAGNTQGGRYEGVDNTNEWGYTVYVDIDGEKGDSQLWSDIYPFYITLSGKVIPAYDSSNPGVSGGDSSRYLQVSVEYENYSNGQRQIQWLAKSVPFKDGACLSGYIGDATPYCKTNSPVMKAGQCTTDGNSLCRLKQIKPIKFLF